jgi:hypothetical protein
MSPATQIAPEARQNTLAARCPRALQKNRVTGYLCGEFALVSCEYPDGVRAVRVYATAVERDKVALLWRRSGCIVPGCFGQKGHPCLDFDKTL